MVVVCPDDDSRLLMLSACLGQGKMTEAVQGETVVTLARDHKGFSVV